MFTRTKNDCTMSVDFENGYIESIRLYGKEIINGKTPLFSVGGAVGQNIAGAMNNMMGGINQQTTPGAVPPPISTVAYHIAVNGQPTGPFDISVLTQMVSTGQLAADSLVWKNGMARWEKAGTVDELKNLLANVMPPIPTED